MLNMVNLVPLVLYLLALGSGLVGLLLALFLGKRIRVRACPPPLEGSVPAGPPAAPLWNPGLSGVRKWGWRGWLAICAGLVLFGLVGVGTSRVSLGWASDTVAETSDGRAPELEPLVRKYCVPFVQSGKAAGLAVAVATSTNTTVMTFGRPALSSSGAIRADTVFEIGSISKTFTGLALARAIERGDVRLEQPVQELLPAGVTLPEAARGITLRHLTTHSSGFPRVADNMSEYGTFDMFLFGGDPYAGFTEADLLEAVRTVQLESSPGSKSEYSNFGATLLGYLLSTKAGLSYDALIRREICQPLRMAQTTATLEPAQAAHHAQGYRSLLRLGPVLLGLRSVPWFARNNLGGAGAVRATITDMQRYLLANMNPEGQPIASALRTSHEELFKEDERQACGMNWARLQGQTLKQTVLWHNGGTGGFRSYLGWAERSQVGVVVLCNSTDDALDELAGDLLLALAGVKVD